jgi:ketosteroid isomerase-like protein
VSEIIRQLNRGYELIWREARIERALGGLPEDFEWVVPGHPEGPVWRGPDAAIKFFREWAEPFGELDVAWDLIEVPPDRALAVIDMHGRGRESGAPVEMRFGQIWTFREGRARRMVFYDDLDEARRDAGL